MCKKWKKNVTWVLININVKKKYIINRTTLYMFICIQLNSLFSCRIERRRHVQKDVVPVNGLCNNFFLQWLVPSQPAWMIIKAIIVYHFIFLWTIDCKNYFLSTHSHPTLRDHVLNKLKLSLSGMISYKYIVTTFFAYWF